MFLRFLTFFLHSFFSSLENIFPTYQYRKYIIGIVYFILQYFSFKRFDYNHILIYQNIHIVL